MVIVKEEHGCEFIFCTSPEASSREIMGAFAERAAIEQCSHDVKDGWGLVFLNSRALEQHRFKGERPVLGTRALRI